MARIRILKPRKQGRRWNVNTFAAFDNAWMSKVQPCSGPDCTICKTGREIDAQLKKKGKS